MAVAVAHAGGRWRAPRVRMAFTLVEMVLSMTICMVILGATYSVVLLASKAVPRAGDPRTCVLEGTRALDRLAGDLSYAIAVSEVTADSIAFSVPDRDGDAAADTLEYAWSGAAGAALTLSMNGGAARPVADDVREFQITVQQGTMTPAPISTWGNETLLISHDSLLSLASGRVSSSNLYGEYFLPAFASEIRRWRVTRVRLSARSEGSASGQALVQIRSAVGGLPTSTVLDQAILNENTLGTQFSWQSFSLANVPPVAASEGLCLIVQWVSDAHACSLQYQNLGYLGTNAGLVMTTNGGTSWTAPGGQSLLFEIYGKLETVSQPATTSCIDQVTCSLRLGPTSASRVEANIRLLNRPAAP